MPSKLAALKKLAQKHYNPSQPRDATGKWASGAGAKLKPASPDYSPQVYVVGVKTSSKLKAIRAKLRDAKNGKVAAPPPAAKPAAKTVQPKAAKPATPPAAKAAPPPAAKPAANTPIAVTLPPGRQLIGRQHTTPLELSAIGETSGNLDHDAINRLHVVRNGWASYEDFLSRPPAKPNHADDGFGDESNFIYAGKRVRMYEKKGDVSFTVDNSVFNHTDESDKTQPKPSRELIGMFGAFNHYLQQPCSDRILTNTPSTDSKERFEARLKHYKKAGFVTISDQLTNQLGLSQSETSELIPDQLMVLDNRRKPSSFVSIQKDSDILIKGQQLKIKASTSKRKQKEQESDWEAHKQRLFKEIRGDGISVDDYMKQHNYTSIDHMVEEETGKGRKHFGL